MKIEAEEGDIEIDEPETVGKALVALCSIIPDDIRGRYFNCPGWRRIFQNMDVFLDDVVDCGRLGKLFYRMCIAAYLINDLCYCLTIEIRNRQKAYTNTHTAVDFVDDEIAEIMYVRGEIQKFVETELRVAVPAEWRGELPI